MNSTFTKANQHWELHNSRVLDLGSRSTRRDDSRIPPRPWLCLLVQVPHADRFGWSTKLRPRSCIARRLRVLSCYSPQAEWRTFKSLTVGAAVGHGSVCSYHIGATRRTRFMRKLASLATIVTATMVLVVPSMAYGTQLVWTDEDAILENSVTQDFEGFLDFTVPKFLGLEHSTFGCEVTVELEATPQTTGKVLAFDPTTDTCIGTGMFADCDLAEHSSNVGAGWNVHVTTEDLEVKRSSGNLTIRNVYANCDASPTHLEFVKITATPILDAQGTIEELVIEGKATNGIVTATGSLFPESGMTLGLINPL